VLARRYLCRCESPDGHFKFVRKLQEAGFGEKQDLQIEFAPIKADLNFLKWMMGALVAIAVANFPA